MRRPNLFIVGHPRSGTTALHVFLGLHKDIYMSTLKEPHYFCKDFHQESDEFYKKRIYFRYRDEQEYLRIFAGSSSELLVGESSPRYLYSKVAAQLIQEFNSSAKIIIILRNPVDFLHSLHTRFLATEKENIKDFEVALASESERRIGYGIPSGVICPSFLYYSEWVKYYDHVKKFYDLFENDNIKILIYEDFKEDNKKIYLEVLEFLNLDAISLPEFREINRNRVPRFKALNKLAFAPSIGRNIFRIPPRYYYLFQYFVFEKLISGYMWKVDRRKDIQPSLRKHLLEKSRDEIVKISDLIQIDLLKKWYYDHRS